MPQTGCRYLTIAGCTGILLSACGGPPGPPAADSLPLAQHVAILEVGTGPSDQGMEMYPGQSRWIFIERVGVSSQDLIVQEVRHLRAESWRLTASTRETQTSGLPKYREHVPVGTATVDELVSAASDLRVELYPINNLTEVHDHVDDSEITGLTIGRRLEQAVGREGLVYVDLRSHSVP
ncbi:MAG TPA: hypothetical protein VG294_04970 [Solirubrobacteraceae bacterium]|nr:hypothetical protein [Solirubrobacteraceae bacterium]